VDRFTHYDLQRQEANLSQVFDVAVIGAGSTGAGIALDAASRGLSVVLIDRGDVASATSSSSSRLIHGGLRYLESGEVTLVAEALRERSILQKIAPHLVRPLGFTIPIVSRSRYFAFAKRHLYSATLWGYDLAGSLRSAKAHSVLGTKEVVRNLPLIRQERLHGGLLYPDSLTDDARLTNSTVLTAHRAYGARVLTYSEVTEVKDKAGTVGLTLRSTLGKPETFEVKAKAVAVAAGVGNQLLSPLFKSQPNFDILPAKGIHLGVPREKLPLNSAAAIDVPSDKRRVFVVPWGRYSYFGTTDTRYDGDLASPDITSEDVAYLLEGLNEVFEADLTPADITGGWSGLRPLVMERGTDNPEEVSRKHAISVRNNVVFVAGGKLTTYRAMATQVTDALCEILGVKAKSQTKRLSLIGSYLPHQESELRRNIDRLLAEATSSTTERIRLGEHLIARYGAEAPKVAEVIANSWNLHSPDLLEADEIYLGEIQYMTKFEGARTVSDLFLRRSRIATLDMDLAVSLAKASKKEIMRSLSINEAEFNLQVDQMAKAPSTKVPK